MDVNGLVDLVSGSDAHLLQKEFYEEYGPEPGGVLSYNVQAVGLNVALLRDWLVEYDEDLARDGLMAVDAAGSFERLSRSERQLVWGKSGFHFGVVKGKDVDFYWGNVEKE